MISQLTNGERLAEMDDKRAFFYVFRAAAQYWRRCYRRHDPLIENGWDDGSNACEEAAKRLEELQVSLENL